MFYVMQNHLSYMGYNTWRNELLWKEYELGRIVPIKRRTASRGAGRKGSRALKQKDDLQMLSVGVRDSSFVCSNDLFREHSNLGSRFPKWKSRYLFQYQFQCKNRLGRRSLSKNLVRLLGEEMDPVLLEKMKAQERARLLSKIVVSPPPKLMFNLLPSPAMKDLLEKLEERQEI